MSDEVPNRILDPGRNCWRIARADRLRCVQDAADYFRLVRAAILSAERSVFLLGWDIAAGLDLLPGESGADAPTKLGELLNFVARRKRRLHCYVLIWDYAGVFAMERDPFSRLRLGIGAHSRVHFGFDDHTPLGASHHQKVVIVDDRLAFVGGIDLTHHRWDTSDHAVDNSLRCNAIGIPYAPYHELALLVEGPIATSLGEFARRRWRQFGRRRMPRVAPSAKSLWPKDVPVDLENVDVAIVRTEPEFAGREAVREGEALFADMIAAARDRIYVESQYFTDDRIADSMARRLRETDGPEIVIVGPNECEGWLERKTMGALRARVVSRLQESDHYGRLRILYPIASASREVCTFVHSKAMIVDDEVLRIGSANLSRRSMGLDTECDLVVVAEGDPRIHAGIRAIRARLLAEHLGVPAETVERSTGESSTLRDLLLRLGGGDRTLAPLELTDAGSSTVDVLAGAIDPSASMEVTRATDRLLPEIEADDSRRRVITWILPALTIFLGLWIALRALGPVGWESLPELRSILFEGEIFDAQMFALGLLFFVVAALLFVPLGLLVFVTVVAVGASRGIALSLLGVASTAGLGYALGRILGGPLVLRWLGGRSRRILAQLKEGGTMTVAVLRAVPAAPSTAVHLLCGAAHVPLRAYAAGSILGLAPIFVALVALASLTRGALREPTLITLLAAALASLALALFTRRIRISLLARRLRRRPPPIEGRDDFD